MFTGIVQAVGRIVQTEALGDDVRHGRRLTIDAADLELDQVRIGDSIAINGACMTVVTKTGRQFAIDVSAESMSKTAGFDALGPVNLERAMRLGDRLDGRFGHQGREALLLGRRLQVSRLVHLQLREDVFDVAVDARLLGHIHVTLDQVNGGGSQYRDDGDDQHDLDERKGRGGGTRVSGLA